MTPSTPLDSFEQFLFQLKIQFTHALKQNYLHPYKSDLKTLLTKTQELNTTLLLVPENNTNPIQLRTDKHTLTLPPHQITTLQTLTDNYIKKLQFLTRRYEALEHYALQNIQLIPYRGFFKEDNTFQHSTHLLFLIPTTKNLYYSLELHQTENHWLPSRHQPKSLEQTIAQVPSSATIMLIENPQNLPLVQTVEHIMLQKYFEKEL